MYMVLHLLVYKSANSAQECKKGSSKKFNLRRGAPEGTLEGAPNDALSNLYKDAQEGAFDVALEGAVRVVLGLHLWLH